jgi:hypothetical protein
MTMDELHGTLTTYKMRTYRKNGHPNRETYFKSMKKTRNKEPRVEEKLGNESNEEEAYFVRRLKGRTNKYKGNLHLKCFNCGRIGHYAKKCHFEENKSSIRNRVFIPRRTTILQMKAMEKKGK